MTKRRCSSRIKSGCLTCKQRHTKCDEHRPACRRCTVSGRACEGYGDPFRAVLPRRQRSSTPVNDCLLAVPPDSVHAIRFPANPSCDTNQHYLNVFCRLSSGLISGLDHGFVQHLFQRAYSPGPIQSALVALSGQIEEFARRGTIPAEKIDRVSETHSVQQYGKALRYINQLFDAPDAGQNHVEIFTAVFLLICYELLRGNDIAALVHLEGALAGLSSTASQHEDVERSTMASLSNLFLRLEIQAISYLGDWKPSSARPSARWNIFQHLASHSMPDASALGELRESLSNLQYRSFQFLRLSNPNIKPPTIEIKNLQIGKVLNGNRQQQRDELHWDLDSWLLVFRHFYSSIDESEDDKEYNNLRREWHLLHIRSLVLLIQLSTCLDQTDQSAFDEHFQPFAAIVSTANTVLQETNNPSATFTMEMGVVEPLYLTAIKCRESSTRRAAVHLLRKAGKEGVWDGGIMACIAEHVIRLEEELAETNYPQSIGCTTCGYDSTLESQTRNVERRWIGHFGRVHGVAIEVDRRQRSVSVTCFIGKPLSTCANCSVSEPVSMGWDERHSRLLYG